MPRPVEIIRQAGREKSLSDREPAALLPETLFREVVQRSLVIPLGTLLGAMALLLGLLGYLFFTGGRADRSNAVLLRISHVEKLAVDAETGVRGYRITGDRTFLEPFAKASAVLSDEVNGLSELVRDDPAQSAELEKFRTSYGAWSAFATNLREQAQTKVTPGLAEHLRGKQLMDGLRASLEQMQVHETNQLIARRTRRTQLRILTVGTVTICGFILAPLLAVLIRGGLKKLSENYRAALETAERERERLRVTLFSIGDGVVATDASGAVTYMNGIAAALTGWAAEEARGKPLSSIFKIINEHSRNPVQNPVSEVLSTGQVIGLANHTLLVAKDGRETPVADSAAPIRDGSGQVSGVVLVFRDQTRERQVETALRQSEERFRSVFEYAATAIALGDSSGRLQQVNPAFCRLLDYSVEELKGAQIRDHIFDPDKAECSALLAELGAGKRTGYSVESRYVRRDGRPIWVRKFVSLLQSSDAKNPQVVALVTDIDERKRAEMLLESQKRSLEMVVEGAPINEVLSYLARVVEEQSDGKATASILLLDSCGALRNGASPGLPADYLKAIDGIKPDANLGTCAAAAATGEVVLTRDLETDPKWQTLKHLPLAIGFRGAWSQPITAHDGRVLGTFGTYFRQQREPTRFERSAVEILARTAALAIERRKVEDERKRFVSLAQNSSDFIGICGPDFIPIFVNRAGLTLVGLEDLAEVRRTPVKDFFFPEDQVRVLEEFFPAVLRDGQGQIEVRFRHFKTGVAIWMLYNVWVITDDIGKVAGLATVSRDITERKRAEEALRVSQEKLAHANRELASRAKHLDQVVAERTAQLQDTIQQLETFSYSIVHDMRAPLRSMRSFAGFVHQEHANSLPDKAREYLRRIMNSAARMDALITDVLNYSRVSRGAADLVPVNLDQLLPDIIEQYPNLQENARFIELERPLPVVCGNTALLTQVFSNLLGNALKFIPESRTPSITVRATANVDRARISVEDNGIGVAAEHQERIFGLFQRLHRPDEYSGTGIGLAIVKRALERMGGATGVEANNGGGSRFWIELALAQPLSA